MQEASQRFSKSIKLGGSNCLLRRHVGPLRLRPYAVERVLFGMFAAKNFAGEGHSRVFAVFWWISTNSMALAWEL